jgi:hypothetical protein
MGAATRMDWRGNGAARSRGVLGAGLALLLALQGCGSSEEPLGPLEVGFGRASLVWRAGAKPGQVGTDQVDFYEDYFLNLVAGALPHANEPDTRLMLEGATDWALGRMRERVEQTEAGTYNYLFEPSVGVEIPPNVSAVVVRRGARKVALVRADMYVMHEQVHRRVAALIEEETGIGQEQLFLSGTHNHSVAHSMSPSIGVWIRTDAFDPRHFAYVSHQIAEAIREADRNLELAELRVARHSLSNVQHNIIGPANAFGTPPGESTEEQVRAGYPYDHFDSDLLMLRFDRAGGGTPLGSIFVFGMHPESLPGGHGLLSGEWPTHVEYAVEEATGAPTMWMPGPLGDVEPDRGRNDPDHHFMRAGFEAMEYMSSLITDRVLDAWDMAGAQPGLDEPTFTTIQRSVHGPESYPLPTIAERPLPRLPMPRVVQDATSMRLHVVRLGDAMLVGVPAEVTTDLALNIKSRLDVEQGNVYQGYI